MSKRPAEILKEKRDEKHAKLSVSMAPKLDQCHRLLASDYKKSSLDLAKILLGKIISRVTEDGKVLRGRIVETEAYDGALDKACHTFGGKRTKRTEAMYMSPGTAYVYFIYGMYNCLNISSSTDGGCVLIRALNPLEGVDVMENLRRKGKCSKQLKIHHLCNGPSKLCQAMDITARNLNKENMCTSKQFYVSCDSFEPEQIISCSRIGISSYGQDAVALPYRFYIFNDPNVSVRNKEAENQFK